MIVEPVAANMGVVPPAPEFLEALREITTQHGSLLIFDEVITGFRVGIGGYQAVAGVSPDLTCLGKIVGGGMPVGAYGGRAEIMSMVAPLGPVYQAGTLSGNPLAMAAGIATLQALQRPGFYEGLRAKTDRIVNALASAAGGADVPVQINRVASMFTVFFSETAGHQLRGRAQGRCCPLRALLSRPPRRRRLLPAFAIRGRLHLRRPYGPRPQHND